MAGTGDVPGWCCSQLVLCPVRGANLSGKAFLGPSKGIPSVSLLMLGSLTKVLGSPGECRVWSSSGIGQQSLVLLSASSRPQGYVMP